MAKQEEVQAYSFDSSSLIHAWTRTYPIDLPFHRQIWDWIAMVAASGRLLISGEVEEELRKKRDGLSEWVRKDGFVVVPPDDTVQKHVRDILHDHPRLIDQRKNRSGCDPWVIGVAFARGSVVVAQEGRSANPTRKPHIPAVCDAYGIRALSLLDFIREMTNHQKGHK